MISPRKSKIEWPAVWRPLSAGCLIALSWALSAILAWAQGPDNESFWESHQRQQAGAAAQIILTGNPLTAAVFREEGLRWKVWGEAEFVGDTAPPLDASLLEKVRDGTPMPEFRGKADDEKRSDQLAVFRVRNQALINAFSTPADAFAKSADENSYVTFAHLWNDPSYYRGKVIPVKGRLVRLRKWPADSLGREGIPFVYEGWIFGPTVRSHPFCVLFPLLPDGFKESEKMDVKVSFNGYFIKKIKYPSADRSQTLETPLLIGPTLVLEAESPPAPNAAPISMVILTCLVLVVVVVAVCMVFLGWYFRRGDKAIKQRLAELHTRRTIDLHDETME